MEQGQLFYGFLTALTTLTIVLLVFYLRKQLTSSEQNDALKASQLEKYEKQRCIDLMNGVMEAEGHERRKIAGQLHDEVSPMLALASFSVSSTLEKAGDSDQLLLLKAQEILSSVCVTIRDLSNQLDPIAIQNFGFREALTDLAETINLSGKVNLESIVLGFEDTQNYSMNFLNDLYRIIQELLHNILKHARTKRASLEVIEHQGLVTIIVEDHGIGFQKLTKMAGGGLAAVRSRVAYLNGKMEISNKQDGGLLVVIEIYLNPST